MFWCAFRIFAAMCRTQVQLLYNPFKEDREDVNNDGRPGHPSTSMTDENFEAVKEMILDNRRITIREVADDRHIVLLMPSHFYGYFRHEMCLKVVPKLLNF